MDFFQNPDKKHTNYIYRYMNKIANFGFKNTHSTEKTFAFFKYNL